MAHASSPTSVLEAGNRRWISEDKDSRSTHRLELRRAIKLAETVHELAGSRSPLVQPSAMLQTLADEALR